MSLPAVHFANHHEQQLIEMLSCLERISKIIEESELAGKELEESKSFSFEIFRQKTIKAQDKINELTLALEERNSKLQLQDLDFGVLLRNLKGLLQRYERMSFFIKFYFYFCQSKKWSPRFDVELSIELDVLFESFFNSEFMLSLEAAFRRASVHVRRDNNVTCQSLRQVLGIENQNSLLNNAVSEKNINIDENIYQIKKKIISLLGSPIEELAFPVEEKKTCSHVRTDTAVNLVFLLISSAIILASCFYMFPVGLALFFVISFFVAVALCIAYSFHEYKKKNLRAEEEIVKETKNDLISQIQKAILFVMAVEVEPIALYEIAGNFELLKLIDDLESGFPDDCDFIVILHALLIDMQDMISSEKPANGFKREFNELIRNNDAREAFKENIQETISSLGLLIKERENKKTTGHWSNFLIPNSLKNYGNKMSEIFLQQILEESDFSMLSFLIKVGGPHLDEALFFLRDTLENDLEVQSTLLESDCFKEARSLFFKELSPKKVSTVDGDEKKEEKYGEDENFQGLDADLNLPPVSQSESNAPIWELKTYDQLEADLTNKERRPVLIQQLHIFLQSVRDETKAANKRQGVFHLRKQIYVVGDVSVRIPPGCSLSRKTSL